MSVFRPSAAVDGDLLRLQFLEDSPSSSVEVKCVVDLTDFGEVIGVEILAVGEQLGGALFEPPGQDTSIRWSYDSESDALYVHVASGPGQVQRNSTARAHLDSSRRLVQLDVSLPRSN